MMPSIISSTARTGSRTGSACSASVADVVYMTSAYYDPERESGFAYEDPDVRIGWPADLELSASARDSSAPALADEIHPA